MNNSTLALRREGVPQRNNVPPLNIIRIPEKEQEADGKGSIGNRLISGFKNLLSARGTNRSNYNPTDQEDENSVVKDNQDPSLLIEQELSYTVPVQRVVKHNDSLFSIGDDENQMESNLEIDNSADVDASQEDMRPHNLRSNVQKNNQMKYGKNYSALNARDREQP